MSSGLGQSQWVQAGLGRSLAGCCWSLLEVEHITGLLLNQMFALGSGPRCGPGADFVKELNQQREGCVCFDLLQSQGHAGGWRLFLMTLFFPSASLFSSAATAALPCLPAVSGWLAVMLQLLSGQMFPQLFKGLST